MVLEHGGEISVDSEEGRGSVFRVVLPTGQVALAKTGS
jgi:signal transduction histidine kinase